MLGSVLLSIAVDNGDYHSLSQIEIDGGIEIYR